MSYHFTPTGALTDASQTASIAEIKTKTDKITITSNLNLNTMNDALTVATATNNTQNAQLAMTSGSNMKTAIDLNSAKTGITTSQTNAITANTAKTGITTTQANAIVASTAANATAVAQLSANAGSQLLTNIAANTTAITANTNAYPQFTNLKRLYNQGGDIYNDGKIKFAWNATTRQLQFYVLDIPSGWNTSLAEFKNGKILQEQQYQHIYHKGKAPLINISQHLKLVLLKAL